MPRDLAAIRTDLVAKRQELMQELGVLTAVPRDPMAAVSFGKRIGEGTTEAVERLNTTGAAKQLAAMLADVERALAKFDDGTYGICDRCAATIPDERLEARPWSALCVRCSALR
jgi:DnaK suppressor protein